MRDDRKAAPFVRAKSRSGTPRDALWKLVLNATVEPDLWSPNTSSPNGATEHRGCSTGKSSKNLAISRAVQTNAGGIGEVLDAIQAALDPGLRKPEWKQTEGRVTLNYRFESEDLPTIRLKLKVEVNSREHFTVLGLKEHRFEVASRWFTGAANLRTDTRMRCSERNSARSTSA
jgi:hypothetical protein